MRRARNGFGSGLVQGGCRRRASLALAAAVFALAGSGLVAGEAQAYQSFFTPLFGKPVADPCNVQGVPSSGGLVVRRQPAIQENDIPRFIALLCGPVYSMPFGTLLVDDAIWQLRMGGSGGAPRHMLQGGQSSLPWNTEISTLNYPAFKGAGGNALGWKDLIKIDKNVQQAQLIASSSGVSFAGATFFLCVIGAINPVLLPVCATAVIVVTVATTLVFSPQIINLIGRYFQRNDAMNNGNWFVWSNGVGFFNGFGDVDQRWINPSLFNAADRAQMRVGVVFSNVLLNQGPDFDLLKRGAAAGAAHARRGAAAQADARFRRLAALVRKLRRSHGRTRTGTRRDERLFGGPRDDYLFGARGRDSLFGRGGDDVLLQGARGNDRIYGGPGDDNIDGHRGGDILGGGPGNDQLVDFFGAAIVRTGSGKDLVVVRDGRRGDTVVCRGPGRKRILADPGDRIVGTISGSARAVGARGCPAGSRVITSGPLPRLGRGY
ncbi:MAG TPA: calcium-binding protein [Thermoleophilaceae bacterium]